MQNTTNYHRNLMVKNVVLKNYDELHRETPQGVIELLSQAQCFQPKVRGDKHYERERTVGIEGAKGGDI